MFVNTRALLLCFHLGHSFFMHEGYNLWVVKLQTMKQILNCVLLKYHGVLHHLQLYKIV